MLTAASLFAGIGGFDLAADRLGVRVVMQAEIEPAAQRVLRSRFPSTTLHPDATAVDLRGVDLVLAGFPCQGLSAAASTPRGRGIFDPKSPSSVVWASLDRIFEAMPEYVLLENADSLGTSRYGDDMRALYAAFTERGYVVHVFSLNAGCFGSLQRRVRTFVLAKRRPWDRPLVGERVVWTCDADAIGVNNQQGGALFCAQPSVTKKSRSYTLFVTESEVRSVTPDGVEALFGYPIGWTDAAGSPTARYERLGNTVSVHAAQAALELLLHGSTELFLPEADYVSLGALTVPAGGGAAGSAFGRIMRTSLGTRNANTNLLELMYCAPVYRKWMHEHPEDVSPEMWGYLSTVEAHGLLPSKPEPWPRKVEVVMEQRG